MIKFPQYLEIENFLLKQWFNVNFSAFYQKVIEVCHIILNLKAFWKLIKMIKSQPWPEQSSALPTSSEFWSAVDLEAWHKPVQTSFTWDQYYKTFFLLLTVQQITYKFCRNELAESS